MIPLFFPFLSSFPAFLNTIGLTLRHQSQKCKVYILFLHLKNSIVAGKSLTLHNSLPSKNEEVGSFKRGDYCDSARDFVFGFQNMLVLLNIVSFFQSLSQISCWLKFLKLWSRCSWVWRHSLLLWFLFFILWVYFILLSIYRDSLKAQIVGSPFVSNRGHKNWDHAL